jgi:Mn-dependent DtxR family transcriptional regulator
MKIFVSWSGARSGALAQALRDWLPLVLHYAEPWLSDADLAPGERWGPALAKELETSNFGVVCITRENLTSPWILFEAGSLAKSLDGSRVIPLLLDVEFSEITGPLAQFQAKKAEREGVLEIVQSVNALAKQPVADARVKELFDALWPKLEKQIAEIPKGTSPAKPSRSQHEILEELVTSVRGLDARLREQEEGFGREARSPRRWRRRFHPFMIDEIAHTIAGGSDDPVSILVLASMFRDDMPWLYELGMEAYRVAKKGSHAATREALQRFDHAFHMMERGPFLKDSDIDREMFHMLEHQLERLVARPPGGRATAPEKPPSRRKELAPPAE